MTDFVTYFVRFVRWFTQIYAPYVVHETFINLTGVCTINFCTPLNYCTHSGRNAIPHPSAVRYTYGLTENLEHVLVDAKAIAFSAVKVHDLRIEAPFLHLVLEIL